MTKLEELKAASKAAYDVYRAADDAYLAAAHDAYAAELRKQAKTPREPVEDEGNPLV
jgi:hypothetical protein